MSAYSRWVHHASSKSIQCSQSPGNHSSHPRRQMSAYSGSVCCFQATNSQARSFQISSKSRCSIVRSEVKNYLDHGVIMRLRGRSKALKVPIATPVTNVCALGIRLLLLSDQFPSSFIRNFFQIFSMQFL
jgi:hypothetical protein